MKTDEQLVADYLAGDRSAFDDLVRRHLKSIYSFARRILGDDHDAEDVSQEAFVRAWRKLRKFDCDQSFRGWIFRIARNAAYDLLKKKKSVPFSNLDSVETDQPFADTLADSRPLPDELFHRSELARVLVEALEKLPERYRSVMVLHYNDRLTFREIGQALTAPLNTVKSRHLRGLILLKKIFSEGLGGREFEGDAPESPSVS
ncbi:MAG: sigma-70 family RNA polymerase sigma factor [Patescibacteria group bacterium]